MDLSKTNVMYHQLAEKKHTKIYGDTICIVDEYVYLGHFKASKVKLTDEINLKKCKMGCSSFGRLH